MSERTVLSMKNITKRFVGITALKNVSVDFYKNEIVAILGENGAGKSTLMKILSGSYPHNEYEGKIILDGVQQKFNSAKSAENAGIAMIYQELNLELDLSVAENICLGRLPKTPMGFIDWEETRQTAKQILKKLNLDIDVDMPVRMLNTSVQQLVSIARALIRNPRILILDEPTSTLTENEAENLHKILKELKDKGLTCVYISHRLEEIFNVCDRVMILRDGSYISEYYKKDGYESERIIEDMIGRKLEVMYPKIEKQIGQELFRVENFTVPHPYSYGKNIVEDVSFGLRKGEILGLTGLVGSSRSELLNAVFGVIEKTKGKVYLDGKEITIRQPSDAIVAGVGLMTEERKKDGFIGTMSIRHNMTLTVLKKILKGLTIDFNKEDKLTEHYFNALDIKASDIDVNVLSLSGGNQQKVVLSKWLMTDLKVLFLDEPTRGIDVGAKLEIYKIIGELAKRGVGIIMISSELPELLAICDRFIVIGKGVVLAELNKDEASEVKILQYASNT